MMRSHDKAGFAVLPIVVGAGMLEHLEEEMTVLIERSPGLSSSVGSQNPTSGSNDFESVVASAILMTRKKATRDA